MTPPDTIVAIASPAGRGAVGVIRISGADVPRIAGIYISGTSIGGFCGRFIPGMLSDLIGWRRPDRYDEHQRAAAVDLQLHEHDFVEPGFLRYAEL